MKSYTQKPKNHYFNYFYKNKKNNFIQKEEVGNLAYLLYIHNKSETVFYEKQGVRICTVWWRRGESNSCPKTSPHGFLRV